MDTLFDKENNKFYQENNDGNTEYKWRLDTKNMMGQKKLLTQMMWRINEGLELTGDNIAHYLLGVYDNGNLGGLSVDDLIKSINILKNVINSTDELCIDNEEIRNINNSYVYYCDIKIKKKDKILNEKNILVLGESCSGKTTLISQLCYNSNHKSYVLKHLHEKITGTTTDIKKEIIGISKNNIINYSDYGGWDEITTHSDTILNVYDIPVINIKTILNYLLGIDPHFIFICAKDIESHDIRFYIDYCRYYNIPYEIVMHTQIINYDKDYFNKILFDISLIKDNSDIILEDTSVFRIIDYYDIPEKGLIVSGNQINNKFCEGDNVILVSGNIHYDIKIKSIHKKTIKYETIHQGESGSFLIGLEGDNKIKINKNSYIINKFDKNNLVDNKLVDNNLVDKHICIQIDKNISDGIYNIILFNGNYSYDIIDIEIKENKFQIDKKYYLQDKKILCIIDNNLCFDSIVYCLIIF
jgi:GTPase